MLSGQRNIRSEILTKIALSIVFLIFFAGFVLTMNRLDLWDQAEFQVIDLVLLSFATLRLGRLISYDLVMQPLRSPFTETVADSSGAGDTVEAKGSGPKRVIGELLSCPICSGTWIAAFLVYGLYLFPNPTRVFLIMTAVICFSDVLNALLELLSWSGKDARISTGIKERKTTPPYQANKNGQKSLATPNEENYARQK